MKPLTKKGKEKMLELSKINEASSYFTVKGILFRITATRRNTNGSWSHTIKNVKMKGLDAYKEIGSVELDKIIKNNLK